MRTDLPRPGFTAITALVLGIFALFFGAVSYGYFALSGDASSVSEMNGIVFDKYRDFAKNWHLVTVRYRQDSGELRFIYANDLAWAGLKSLKPGFPDGAVFAKIGMVSEGDPAFPSSVVPSQRSRYQFMLKDKKKYKDTDGWGYALFDPNGVVFKDQDGKSTTQACAACHRIVPERDYVFARPAHLEFDANFPRLGAHPINPEIVDFVTRTRKELPGVIAGQLEEAVTAIDDLKGKIKNNAFVGTLDEIVPLLLNQAKLKGHPALFMIDEKNFSLVAAVSHPLRECKAKSYRILVHLNSKAVRDAETCQ